MKIFVGVSGSGDAIIKECEALFSFEGASIEDADIVVSDSVDAPSRARPDAKILLVGEVSSFAVDSFYESISNCSINGYFCLAPSLPQLISEECFRISERFIERGLSLLSTEENPIMFDSLSSTGGIGKKVDDILIFTGEKIGESELRNMLTSQFLMTFSFADSGSYGRVELEFLMESERLLVSTSTAARDVSDRKIYEFLKENRSLCRNLLEDAGVVSITYTQDTIRVLSMKYLNDQCSLGLSVYSSFGKQENVDDQIKKDREDGLHFVNFSMVHSGHQGDEISGTGETSGDQIQVIRGGPAEDGKDDPIIVKGNGATDAEGVKWQRVEKSIKIAETSSLEIIEEARGASGAMNEIIRSKAEDRIKIKELEKHIAKQSIMTQRLMGLAGNLERIKKENASVRNSLKEQRNLNMRDAYQREKLKNELKRLQHEVNDMASKRHQLYIDVEKLKDNEIARDEDFRKSVMSLKLSEGERQKLEKATLLFEKRNELARERERVASEKSFQVSNELKSTQGELVSLEQKIRREQVRSERAEMQNQGLRKKISEYENGDKALRIENRELVIEMNRKENQIVHLTREYEKMKQEAIKKREGQHENSIVTSPSQQARGVNQKSIDDIKKQLSVQKERFEVEKSALMENMKRTGASAERQLKTMRDTMVELGRKLTDEQNGSRKKDAKIRQLETEGRVNEKRINELENKIKISGSLVEDMKKKAS